MNEEEKVEGVGEPQPESGIPAGAEGVSVTEPTVVGAEAEVVVNAEVEEPAPARAPAETPAEVSPAPEAPILENPGTGTAQMGRNEPFAPEEQTATPEAPGAPVVDAPSTLATPTTTQAEVPTPTPTTPPAPANVAPPATASRSLAQEILLKARRMIAWRKQKKLTRIMGLFQTRSAITNDDVEKLLHVSDATATRYLAELERTGLVKQTGKTGRGVRYVKVG